MALASSRWPRGLSWCRTWCAASWDRDYRVVIPASMVGGALFMPLADALARTLMALSEILHRRHLRYRRRAVLQSGARGGRRAALTERKKRLRTGAMLAILAMLALLALWCDINAGYRSISLKSWGRSFARRVRASPTRWWTCACPGCSPLSLVGGGCSLLPGCLLQGRLPQRHGRPGRARHQCRRGRRS
ncbi:MAG: hypothetical protein ACLTDR_07395 [Adlercreutzia equolifaciens]